MISDINGQALKEGDAVQLLCKVVSLDPHEGVRVRIMNSEMELAVGCKFDEALGGMVADSELAKFVEVPRDLCECTDKSFEVCQQDPLCRPSYCRAALLNANPVPDQRTA